MQNKILFIIKLLVAFIIMFIADLIAIVTFVLTFFQGRRVIREFILSPFARIVLYIFGISYTLHKGQGFSQGQKVYISNHTSTIDVFVLCALALPNTRFFMSKVTYKFLPLTIAGKIMGIFYIDTQDKPEKRTACFQNAEKTLRKTGESVYLSPEGVRVTTGEIGKFNRGSFHLATNLKVPLCPFYIAIPQGSNPGKGFNALPGKIDIYELPQVETKDWVIEDIEKNKKRVRDIFLNFHKKLNPSTKLSH